MQYPHRHHFKLSQAVLGLTLCLGLGAAQADQLDSILAAKKIRVAIDLGVPPFGMKDERLHSTGSDVAAAELLAKDLGVALEIVPTTGANRIPFLQTDKADVVVSSLSITPEREKVIDFSVPYAAILIVVGAPKAAAIHSMADLAGRKVVATRGTTNDAELTKLAPSGTQIVRFDDDATSITAVISGQADIFATAPPLLKAINEKAPARQMDVKFVLKTNMLGIGLLKNEPRLKARIDAFVRARLKDGQLNMAYKQFQGADLPADVLRNGG